MFNLTSSEKKTLLFISIIIVASGFYQLFQPYQSISSSIDYSQSDSVFNRLSRIDYTSKTEPDTSRQNSDISSNHDLKPAAVKNKINKSTNTKLLPSSININTASEIELQKLPRIGPVMAQRIIDYRNKHGKFKTGNDLLKVKGIGKKTLEKFSPYIILDKN